MIKKTFFKILILISFLTSTGIAFAAVADYELLAPLPDENGVPQNKVAIDENYLQVYFRAIYRMGIALATGLAVLMIIMGGIEYITTDAIGGKEEGKERISNAILGLLLALSSYVILKTIDPNLVNVSLNIESVDQEALARLLSKEEALRLRTEGDTSILSDEQKRAHDAILAGEIEALTGTGIGYGKATNFGYNDLEDNGVGSPLVGDGSGLGVHTDNQAVMGVALPRKVLESYFNIRPGDTSFASWAAVRNAGVKVSNGSKEIIVPIVDIGPGAGPLSRGVVIDETYALNKTMGGDGNRSYQIISNHFSGGRQGVTYVKP